MEYPVKVYLCGSEQNGWALDADLETTRQALAQLPDLVKLTSLKNADVVHAVWEYPVLMMNPKKLEGKRVVCQVCNDFMRLHGEPAMTRAPELFGLWITMSRESVREVNALGYTNAYIPYAVDTTIFTKDIPSDKSVADIRRRFGIPEDTFIISNFMRDSDARNLLAPKIQKGTEMLLEIGRQLVDGDVPVHFLFAGPRRHWIRTQMEKHSIPYTFVGESVKDDDNDLNIQPSDVVNLLYHASDLHLVTSRWEGGPRAVLECAATRTPILCTPVGIASDILCSESLFSTATDAVEKIKQHVGSGSLDRTVEEQYQVVTSRHIPDVNAPLFRQLYQNITEVPAFTIPSRWRSESSASQSFGQRIIKKIRSITGMGDREKQLCISLWHEFHKPPYGGGNQFMMALERELKRQGIKVVVNKFARSVDVHICNSAWFDKLLFEKKAKEYPLRMIHRIDGPTTLYRGEGSAEDDKIFALNKQFASATVFQSAYSFKKSYELGYRAVAPMIISNSVNNDIFHSSGKTLFSEERKVRLISTSWSDNPRKGGPFLKWLDSHLDWERFEYTFVGRVSEEFENIKHIPPKGSEELADLLRQHDVFVSVSHHEPCSNALLEALSCGLPALYRDDGGNRELVSFGGMPFEGENDILERLNQMVMGYQAYQNLIHVNSIEEIAKKYISLSWRLVDWNSNPNG